MSKFKYDITLKTHSVKKRNSIEKSLKELGYEDSSTSFSKEPLGLGIWRSGRYSRHMEVLPNPSVFTFDTSVVGNTFLALALAAVHDDNRFHEGEWWVYDASYSGEAFTFGSLYQIRKDGETNQRFSVKADNSGEENGYGSRVKVHKASADEILNFFKYMSMPKILGYRIIKDGPGFKKGYELNIPTDLPGGKRGWRGPVVDGLGYEVRFPNIVVTDTEWFEPIYEEVVADEILILGSKDDKILINGKGEILYGKERIPIDIKDVEKAIISVLNLSSFSLGGYAIQTDHKERFLRVGCSAEKHTFSIDELQAVVDTYYKLNKK